MEDLVDTVTSPGERLPTGWRGMDFRVIARDNRVGGGGVDTADMLVTVVGNVGPFRVTSPNSSAIVAGRATVRWDVAGTDAPPISVSSVNILLSTDSGLTYPFTLATATANDGEELVDLPAIVSNFARVKVEAVDNIFFDISNANFSILACSDVPAPVAELAPIAKSRYLSLSPQGNGLTKALRVTLTNLPVPFQAFEGETRWVGPPQTYADTLIPPTEIVVSALQCTPYYSDWAGIDKLHLFGPDILPSAVYDIQAVACDPAIEANYSAPMVVVTSVWADVAPPYQPDTVAVQPNVFDITTVVDRVKQVDGALSRAFTQLQPNLLDPTRNSSVFDISITVDAVKGVGYPFSGPVGCGG